ncbi:DUF1858 domain-containing protein [Latilactobacillus curvatus]|uniref:DUF1858 domain-containing protein n=1 Tax=Latilactobacillus curvatus TaxID=28038 RepID=A0A385AFB7_LATCU|nr:DUF1858 domain-containing protein [Latilactobacillus curvatus]ASN62540.1 hypothetical protein CGZ47_08310 [Latilactobacillus curvatus]AXN36389.1 DUF1858 domain-containing protein [Latilactobacillus curvatus]MCP8861408.1 DUF1858 domain-containing protein [Latilactobacillus curvatus]MCP8868977.1 DUF1858 domain-containing protein [Latilactobacillus curvatus]MCP8872506.1 DUF1858 domain-containing protein [Latilactobacillus curvatus]
MAKQIKLSQTVYELVTAYPEVVPVLVEIGLDGVTNPALLNTAGRFMTLPKGAKMKQIPLTTIIASLEAQGFEVLADV